MAGAYKTPGVYIVEKDAFPNSVVEVATAVPAFIGYTQKADNKGTSLLNKPWRISSMSEFQNYFGGAPAAKFSIDKAAAGQDPELIQGADNYVLTETSKVYRLYHSMMLFFQNGGGACYILSVGKYGDDVDAGVLIPSVDILLKEQEPTMVVIPDAVTLDFDDCIAVQQATLGHCAKTMSRFAILDIPDGYKDRQDPNVDAKDPKVKHGDCIDRYRGALGTNYLDYAAAYYPWLNTSIVQTSDLDFTNVDNVDQLVTLLTADLAASNLPQKKVDGITAKIGEIKAAADAVDAAKAAKDQAALNAAYAVAGELHKVLAAVCPLYNSVLLKIKAKLNLLPPAAAMAGIYTMVDNNRGVWKAPANVSLNSVISPSVNITHDEQEDLNVTTAGKSINAIRPFIGEGTLVWGARTLDGNSLDWRYINVRRTMIMLEESIKLATKAYVFEPNVANTWVTIKGMIRNFLTGIWKRGGLAGASPDDAFGVFVGLGETMTAEDILEGVLRVTVLVALSRPAEFIEITFQQQLQKS